MPTSVELRALQAALPNEGWQSDMTHWSLADGTGVEIVNVVNDHSRFCLASLVLLGAIERHGAPAVSRTARVA